MEFSVEAKQLKNTLSMADRLVGGLGYGNCFFETSKKGVTIYSSDSNSCWIKSNMPSTVKTKGQFATEAGVLKDLRFQGKNIDFSLKKGKLGFKCGRSKGELSTVDASEISKAPPKKIKLTHTLSGSVFQAVIEAMSYNSDVIESVDIKPIIISSDGKTLKCSHNDRYCLGQTSIEHEKIKPFSIIIPLDVILGVMPYVKDDFEFGSSEDMFRIKCKDFDLTHTFIQPEANLVDSEKALKEISKEKSLSEIEMLAKDVNKVLDELSSFVGTVEDTKVQLVLNKKKKNCEVVIIAAHGKLQSGFDLKSITKSVTAKLSLYLLNEFLSITEGDVKIRVFSNKLLICDDNKNFIMPTTEKVTVEK